MILSSIVRIEDEYYNLIANKHGCPVFSDTHAKINECVNRLFRSIHDYMMNDAEPIPMINSYEIKNLLKKDKRIFRDATCFIKEKKAYKEAKEAYKLSRQERDYALTQIEYQRASTDQQMVYIPPRMSIPVKPKASNKLKRYVKCLKHLDTGYQGIKRVNLGVPSLLVNYAMSDRLHLLDEIRRHNAKYRQDVAEHIYEVLPAASQEEIGGVYRRLLSAITCESEVFQEVEARNGDHFAGHTLQQQRAVIERITAERSFKRTYKKELGFCEQFWKTFLSVSSQHDDGWKITGKIFTWIAGCLTLGMVFLVMMAIYACSRPEYEKYRSYREGA